MKKCSSCNRELGLFFRKKHCTRCGEIVCKDCNKKIEVEEEIYNLYFLLGLSKVKKPLLNFPFVSTFLTSCSNCYEKLSQELERIKKAIELSHDKEIFNWINISDNMEQLNNGIEIESAWHKNPEHCDRELCAQAAFYSLNNIFILSTEETEKERTNDIPIYKKYGNCFNKLYDKEFDVYVKKRAIIF